MMNNLSLKIKSKIKERGLSVSALEKIAGLKPGAVHNILQGKSKNPTAHTLKAISNALECNIHDLIHNHEVTEIKSMNWKIDLFQEAVQIADKLFKKYSIDPSYKQILSYIEEIYSYALNGKSDHIDRRFAEWLINKELRQ